MENDRGFSYSPMFLVFPWIYTPAERCNILPTTKEHFRLFTWFLRPPQWLWVSGTGAARPAPRYRLAISHLKLYGNDENMAKCAVNRGRENFGGRQFRRQGFRLSIWSLVCPLFIVAYIILSTHLCRSITHKGSMNTLWLILYLVDHAACCV